MEQARKSAITSVFKQCYEQGKSHEGNITHNKYQLASIMPVISVAKLMRKNRINSGTTQHPK